MASQIKTYKRLGELCNRIKAQELVHRASALRHYSRKLQASSSNYNMRTDSYRCYAVCIPVGIILTDLGSPSLE